MRSCSPASALARSSWLRVRGRFSYRMYGPGSTVPSVCSGKVTSPDRSSGPWPSRASTLTWKTWPSVKAQPGRAELDETALCVAAWYGEHRAQVLNVIWLGASASNSFSSATADPTGRATHPETGQQVQDHDRRGPGGGRSAGAGAAAIRQANDALAARVLQAVWARRSLDVRAQRPAGHSPARGARTPRA